MIKFDELNSLNSEQINSEQIYRDYFDIMPISEERKEVRVQLAIEMERFIAMILTFMQADVLSGEEIDEDFYSSYIEREYKSAVDKYAEHIDGDTYLNMYIHTMACMLVANTKDHIESDYYYSQGRAINIAKNESNHSMNYDESIEATTYGATSKMWVSVGDNRVRPTHQDADGQVVDVFSPFIVGGSEMMFPMDSSLGADWSEIDGCRCCVEYINDDGEVVLTE